MYTKPEVWPTFWKEFKDIGRIWSSAKVRSLTRATEELDSVSPAKLRYNFKAKCFYGIQFADYVPRHLHISTVVKNDLATLEFAYQIFEKKIFDIKHVKGLTWTIVFQPVHSSTMQKGRDNVLGLNHRKEDLVVTLFSVVWEHASDDAIVNAISKAGMDEIRLFAEEKGTADAFCYLNWCPNDSNPFTSYGKENLRLLQDVSKKFDPDGLFQRVCIGGYKLPSKNKSDK